MYCCLPDAQHGRNRTSADQDHESVGLHAEGAVALALATLPQSEGQFGVTWRYTLRHTGGAVLA